MITSTITWTDSITVGVTKHIVYRDDIKLGEVPIGDPAIWYDDNAIEGITYKYEVQAVAGIEESTQEVVSVNIFNITIPNEVTVVIQTTSTSNVWTPDFVTNTGNTLIWEVTGDVTPIPEQTIDIPIFDLSDNTGTAIITIKSTTAFAGLTQLQLNFLLVSSANVLAATDLEILSVKGDYALSSLDISTLVNLKALVCRTELLTTIDLSNNVLLDELYVYANNLNGIDISNNPLLFNVYIGTNDIPTADLDAVINDADAAGLSNGVIDMLGNAGNITQAAQPAYNNLIGKGWTIDADPPAAIPTGDVPVLSNWHVKNTDRNRIYFDSSSSIDGLTAQGFIVPGNSILGITTIGTNTTGHFLTVGTSFTFWDNNTIRLEGGDSTVFDFTMQHIVNQILEPVTTILKYAAPTTQGTGSGDDEANAWSYEYAGDNALPGTKVMMLAGTSSVQFNISISGNPTEPIIFEGYNNIAADVLLTRTPGLTMNATIMPLFLNTYIKLEGTGILDRRENIILRNIQVQPNSTILDGITIDYDKNILLDNVYITEAKHGVFAQHHHFVYNLRMNRVTSTNNGDTGMSIPPVSSLFDDLYLASSYVKDMDYFFQFLGVASTEVTSSIVKDSYIERFVTDSHPSHGISLKANNAEGSGYKVERILLENIEIVDVASAPIEFRHSESQYNVARNINVTLSSYAPVSYYAIRVNSGSYNIVEDSTFETEYGVHFFGSTEDSAAVDAGHNNKFINCVFKNSSSVGTQATSLIFVDNDFDFQDRVPNNNEFINCTLYNANSLFVGRLTSFGIGNKIINSIIFDVDNEYLSSDTNNTNFAFEYTDSWDGWLTNGTPVSGTENISIDPQFVDVIDFVPQNEFLRIGIVNDVHYDKNNAQRFYPTTVGAVTVVGESITITDQYSISAYAETITIPAYDNGNPAHKLIQTNVDWLDINSGTYTHFYVEPGDYNALNKITLSADGTSGAKRYISLYNGNDLHPGKLTHVELARARFLVTGDYWVIDRMAYWDSFTSIEINQIQAGSYNIFNRYLYEDINGACLYIYKDSHSNTIQNSRVERNSLLIGGLIPEDRAAFGLHSNNEDNVSFINNKFIQNEIYNFNDGIQLIRQPDSLINVNCEGTIIDANIIYIDTIMYTDGLGNADSNGNFAYAENAIDLKCGSDNPVNPIIVTNNYMAGYRRSDTTNSNLDSQAAAVVCHYNVNNMIFTDNLIVNSRRGISIADPRTGYALRNSTINNNIMKDIQQYGLVISDSDNIETKYNLFKNIGLDGTTSGNILQNNTGVPYTSTYQNNLMVNANYSYVVVTDLIVALGNNEWFDSTWSSTIHDPSDTDHIIDPTINYNDINIEVDRFTNNERIITITKVTP